KCAADVVFDRAAAVIVAAGGAPVDGEVAAADRGAAAVGDGAAEIGGRVVRERDTAGGQRAAIVVDRATKGLGAVGFAAGVGGVGSGFPPRWHPGRRCGPFWS